MTAEALARTVQEWRDKVADSGSRAWPEWVGKPDTPIPPKVRARIVMVWGMVCYLTGVRIVGEKPEYEHVIPLAMGGENREGNIRPVWAKAHKGKSAAEQGRKAKADRQRRAAVVETQSTLRGQGFRPRPKQQRASKPLTKIIPQGQGLYK